MRKQATLETENKPFIGTATHIDFNRNLNEKSMDRVMSSLHATRVDTDRLVDHQASPHNTYKTDMPPYEVLTYLDYEGYKVVRTHSVGLQHMWTPYKQDAQHMYRR